jgi:hypothetical protein
MATFADFQAIVRAAVRRGDSLNVEIASAAKRAIEFIEKNYNLPYMRRVLEQTVTNEAVISGADGNLLKSVQYVRWIDSCGTWHRIVQIDPDQLVSNNGVVASGYEHLIESDGVGNITHRLVFDAAFATPTDVEILIYRYSRIDLTNPSDADLWLVNNAEGALLARTMINLAPIMREPQVFQMYQQLWQEEQNTLQYAVHELEQGNR